MAPSLMVAFWGVSVLFVITPGADWAYAITAGLRHRTVTPAVGGLLAGHLVATLVVAAGVAAVVARTPAVLTALTLAGATYLVWLGVQTLRSTSELRASDHTCGETSRLRRALTGAGISGLNPKVLLLFLALLPQFTDPSGSWPLAAQITALGLVHVATCAVVYLAVGIGARTVLTGRPSAAAAVTRFSGAAMVVIGLVLLVEQVLH